MEYKTASISFCKKRGNNVIEAEDKKQIIDILKQKYSINFKSNRAMVLNSKTINFLKNPHVISVKTTGTNYFLFLTRINTINCAFYIDRKIKQGYTYPRIILIDYSFNNSVYDDTLLDGEMIKDDKGNWMFLISDLILYEGQLLKKNILERINTCYNLLDNQYKEDDIKDICPLRIKKIFAYSDYDKLVTMFIPNLKYSIRGLYFNTLNPKHNNHLFLYPNRPKNTSTSNKKTLTQNTKSKIGETSTVKIKTFELRKTIQPEIYDLYCLDNKEIVKYDVARISTLKISKLIYRLFSEKDIVYVKCKFNSKFNKWEPYDECDKDKLCDIKYLN